jgi:hypothetical protein
MRSCSSSISAFSPTTRRRRAASRPGARSHGAACRPRSPSTRRTHPPARCRGDAPGHPGTCLRRGLASRIDRPLRLRRFLRPVGQKAPLQQIEVALAAFGMPANDGCSLRRGNVPGRRQVRQRVRRAEDPRDGLGGQEAGVATAHGRDSWLCGARSQAQAARRDLPATMAILTKRSQNRCSGKSGECGAIKECCFCVLKFLPIDTGTNCAIV